MKITYLSLLMAIVIAGLTAHVQAEVVNWHGYWVSSDDLAKLSAEERTVSDHYFADEEAKMATARALEQKPIDPPKPDKSASAASIVSTIEALGLVLLVLFFYFLPTYIGRSKRNADAIFVLNMFAGWSFIGWIIALVWAYTKDSPAGAQP